jgi:hydroxymethylglutaryl-CoA lyase
MWGSFVMPGLVPGIHVFLRCIKQGVDGRDKPGHDRWGTYAK